MGLLGTWNANNLVITNGQNTSYSMSLQKGDIDGDGSQDYFWEFHRYCTMTFSYVGMDYQTAVACASALTDRYTRKFMISEPSSEPGAVAGFLDIYGGEKLMAQIAVTKTNGKMYSVECTVSEDDAKMRMAFTGDYDPVNLFLEIETPGTQYYRTYEDWTNPTPDPSQQE